MKHFPTYVALAGLALSCALPVSAADCNPARGQQIFESKCAMCHTVKKEQGHMAGPNLAGVIGRPVGKAPGFKYSAALSGAKDSWDSKLLDAFLKAPMEARPGTAMPFSGIKSEPDRAALTCYLGQN